MPNYYAQLASRGALRISGEDTRTFLQGQTTCDITQLSPQRAVAGAYCTPQGRMLCDFLCLPWGDNACLLSMHAGICETAAASFAKYIVFSKAEITDTVDTLRQYAIWGTDAASAAGLAPGAKHQVSESGGALWVQRDTPGHWFEVYAPIEHAAAVERQLAEHFEQAGEESARLLDIRAGIGHIEPATQGEFLPHMLNYQLTNRISFSKGCYTGQEVVARMHYRGKLKRAMLLAKVDGAAAEAGAPLLAVDREKSVGTVVNAAADDGHSLLLAVVSLEATAGELRLGSPSGPELELLDLPYPLDESAAG